jgi:hypothetical protein
MCANVHICSRCGAAKMRRRQRPRPISPDGEAAGLVSDDIPDIEIWQDPEWEPALSALHGWVADVKFPGFKFTGKSDPKPLAKLLISGKAVPQPVARALALWLDPPWGKKGPRLTATLPKRYYPGTESLKAQIALKKRVEEARLRAKGKLESAVKEVMTETGYSRSYVMKAWQLNIREIVIGSSKFNPDPFV